MAHLKFSLPTSSKVIVAVSGGADSVALLDILSSAGYTCVVAHCNFHLRGEESNRDERFVTDLANHYQLPFRKIDFQTEEYASMKSISIEMAARELRYSWFRQLRIREGADVIAVAHHSDDVVETFFLNLSRGTGLRGLTGMKELTDSIWRPLLNCSRADILAYLQEKSLSHVEDSTNTDTVYKRNKIRHEVIPMMQSLTPSFKNNLLNTMAHLRQTEEYVNHHLTADVARFLFLQPNGSYQLSTSRLKEEGDVAPFLLYEVLSKFEFTASTIASVYQNLDSMPGKCFYSKGSKYQLTKERDYFYLSETTAHDDEVFRIDTWEETSHLPFPLSVQIQPATEVSICKNPAYCYLDQKVVEENGPLVVRHWQEGDWFVPFGMKGKKKISDFFIDAKLSNEEKRNCWLLAHDKEVVWVIGMRSNNRFRVVSSTKNILILHAE